MLKQILIFIFGYSSLFASSDSLGSIDLTMTWVGILCLIIVQNFRLKPFAQLLLQKFHSSWLRYHLD